MATLKQLVEQGIKIGTLVKTYQWPLSLAQYNGKYFAHIGSDGWHLHGDLVLEDETDFEITTAFDTGTTIDELHVPEPVDSTGWVMIRDNPKKYKIVKLLKSNRGDIVDIGKEAYLSDVCRLCLPPENNILK